TKKDNSSLMRQAGAVLAVFGLIALSVFAVHSIRPNTTSNSSSTSLSYAGLPEDEQRVLFEQFKVDFGKEYPDDVEEEKRWEIFQANLAYIDALNEKSNGVTYKLNQFADLTQEEFKEYYLTFGVTKAGTTYTRAQSLPGEVSAWSESECQACTRFP